MISALGLGGLKASAQPTTLYSDSTRALLVALRELEIRRFLVISSGGVEYDEAAPWFYRALIRPYLINNYLDMVKMETILEHTEDLDWTSVRPTYLKEGPSQPYRVRNRKVQGGSFTIHRVDLADFVVNQAEKCDWIKQYPTLSY